MAEKILMSNGVALWLAKNTKLSIDQIAEFCNMHPLQIHNFRENISSQGVVDCNPISVFFLTQEEITRCENDKNAKLEGLKSGQKSRANARKSGILEGSLWMIKKYPDLEAAQIAKLFKCSLVVVKSVKNENYKHLEEVLPKNPVSLGLCTQQELDEYVLKYTKQKQNVE